MTDQSQRKLKLVAVVGVAVVMMLIVGAAELALRLLGLGAPLLYEESLAYRYALQPSQDTVRLRGARVTIDANGLRTDDDWQQPGAARILFVGDSVTYGGSYIDNGELFSSISCERLRDRGHVVVCGNAGTNGYGVENMAMRVRFGLEADVYVVTLLADDTLRGLASLPGFPYFSRPLPPLLPAITEASLFVVDAARARLRFDRGGGPYQARGPLQREVAAGALQRLQTALAERQRLGATVLLVYSPPRRAIGAGDDAFEAEVIEMLRADNGALLDLGSVLRSPGADLDQVFYDNVHLDVAGHALYGETIAERLETLLSARDVARR